LGYHVIFWGDLLASLLDCDPNLLRQPSTTKHHRLLAEKSKFETRIHTWLRATEIGSRIDWQTEQDSLRVEVWTSDKKQVEFEAGLSSCGLLPWWEEPSPLQEWQAKTMMSDWQGRRQTEQGTALKEEEWETKTVISDWQGKWQTVISDWQGKWQTVILGWQGKWQTEPGTALKEEECETKTVISDWQGNLKW
jgi:hypothetical protein